MKHSLQMIYYPFLSEGKTQLPRVLEEILTKWLCKV